MAPTRSLRADGLSPVESIKVTRAVLGVGPSEAKRIVHASHAWTDRREEFDDLHDLVEQAASQLWTEVGFPTKKAAHAALADAMSGNTEGTVVSKSTVEVEDFLREWLAPTGHSRASPRGSSAPRGCQATPTPCLSFAEPLVS